MGTRLCIFKHDFCVKFSQDHLIIDCINLHELPVKGAPCSRSHTAILRIVRRRDEIDSQQDTEFTKHL